MFPRHRSPDLTARRAPLPSVALAAVVLLCPGLSAQEADARAILAGVREEYEKLSGHHDLGGVRRADRALQRLYPLEHAPEEVRQQAARLLREVIARRGAGPVFRLRVTAAELLVRLTGDAATVQALLRLTLRVGDDAWEGFDFHLVRALAHCHDPRQVDFLVDRLDDGRDEVVRICAASLAGLQSEDLAARAGRRADLVEDLAKSAEPPIRASALEILGRLPGPRGLGVLGAATTAKSGIVRLAAARALGGKLDQPGADAMLGRLLTDPLARVREEAATSFRHARTRDPVPLLIARMSHEPLRLRAAIAETLDKLCGLDLGCDPQIWKDWLTTVRGTGSFDPAEVVGRVASRRRYEVSWYGIPILSDRIIFVIDVSGSMDSAGGRDAKTRLMLAQEELIGVLRKLDSTTRFNILAFSWSCQAFRRRGLVKASPATVGEAVRFVSRLKAGGGTNTFDALRQAFDDGEDVDTIYLLSDGTPTVGQHVVQERIVALLDGWNRLRGIRIHTVALLVGELSGAFSQDSEDKDDAAHFMRLLASATGGISIRRP